MRVTLLVATGLACVRGDRMLWRGVDITLAAGAAVHISGPNGTGKTSLIRILAGLLPAFAGRVERATTAGLIDETLALDRDLPLAAALGFWARVDGQPKTAIAAALDRLAIGHLGEVPARFLSTGQRKRAALARLLIGGASLWLLDEPANGLDRAGVDLLEALIAAHRADGGAVVLASHLPLALPGSATLAIADFAP